jgi:hypothetical protein
MAQRAADEWNVLYFGVIGFLLGAALTGVAMLSHPYSALSVHTPIAMAIFGGIMGAVVFGGAAISHNRFPGSMEKFTD